MPDNASAHGNRPNATSKTAPATAQTASGQRNGRAMTPAVAKAAMPHAATMLPSTAMDTAVSRSADLRLQLFGGERGARSARFSRSPRLGFGHDETIKRKAGSGYTGERQERRAISGVNDNEAGNAGRERSPDALSGDHRALRHVEATGAAHQIGDDDRKNRAVDAGADAVEQLHADQPKGVFGKRIETAANGQNRKRDQKERLASPGVRFGADQHGHRHHHELRREDTSGHQAGPQVLVLQRELLADQRQHGGVGEVEHDGATGENQQRPAGEKHAHT